MTRATALSDDRGLASAHPNAHPRYIRTNVEPVAHAFPDTVGHCSFAVPRIETEDAVRLGDGMPALNVGQGPPRLLPGLDVLGAQFRFQVLDLCVSKRHHLVLTEMVRPPLPSVAPEMS